MQSPVIVIPGIQATALRDEYDLPPSKVWSMMQASLKDTDRIVNHPYDLRYELIGPSRVMPDEAFETFYKELVEELRNDLKKNQPGPVPVYIFAYDWRLELDVIEDALLHFIKEIQVRTWLLPHYKNAVNAAEDIRIDLIGHSMGGVILAGLLAKEGRNVPVGKVATIATPFRGSYEAVLAATTGRSALGLESTKAREREAARLTPALYHLLPSHQPVKMSASPGSTPQPIENFDFFDPSHWQPNVVQGISKTIEDANFSDILSGPELLATLLTQARVHRDRMEAFQLSQAGLDPSRWLCLVGIGEDTRSNLKIVHDGAGNFMLVLDDAERKNTWSATSPETKDYVETGDSTVPFLGAVPSFLERKHLVCLTGEDFGYWEIQDKVLHKAAGLHATLPNMDLVIRLVLRYLQAAPDQYGNTWGRPAPGVALKDWAPAIHGLKPSHEYKDSHPDDEPTIS